MNEKRNFDYKRLHPFKWYILENFPFLEDSIDVLTNYQLFCKLGEMYNKEIDSLNTLGIQVEGITDWFDNLDVQEEINNKLDKMAESGQLEEIISAYLNSTAIFGFDNVESMKQATNLINGSYAKTLGYYEKNDGGSALYKIRTITNEDNPDNMFTIRMNNETLVAELIIINNNVNIKQIGAKSNDNNFDNSSILQNINNKGYNIFIPEGDFYLSNEVKINIENGLIFGNSAKSSLLKNSTYNDDELILIYSTGDYETRNKRISKIHDFSLIGEDETFTKIGLKIGGDTSTNYEGHVECLNFENIHIKNFNTGIYLNSHLYKDIFTNVIIDQVYYSLKSDSNQTDTNESNNFIGCAFWSGSIYLKMDANFIGCTLHINHQESINNVTTNIYIDECMVNFTDCHFESLNTTSIPLTTPLENIIVARYSSVIIDNPFMIVSGNKITINDSVFKTINPTSNEVKNVSTIILKNGKCKYLFGRINPGSNFVLCKGNIEIFTDTLYRSDSNSQLGYKIYDYSADNVLSNSVINPIQLSDALSNATMNVSSNTYNFTKSSEAANSFGFYKLFKTNGHRAANISMNVTSDKSAVKIQKRLSNLTFNTSSIVFLDKDGNVIQNTLNSEIYTDGQTLNFNVLINIPINCEYIKFGVVGYGFQYQTDVTFTITKMMLELC